MKAVRPAGDKRFRPRPAGAASSLPAVRLQGTTLLVDGKPFVPRAIGWRGEPLGFLAERGFNTLVLPQLPTREQSAEARQHNLWLICTPPRPDELAERGLGNGDRPRAGMEFRRSTGSGRAGTGLCPPVGGIGTSARPVAQSARHDGASRPTGPP